MRLHIQRYYETSIPNKKNSSVVSFNPTITDVHLVSRPLAEIRNVKRKRKMNLHQPSPTNIPISRHQTRASSFEINSAAGHLQSEPADHPAIISLCCLPCVARTTDIWGIKPFDGSFIGWGGWPPLSAIGA